MSAIDELFAKAAFSGTRRKIYRILVFLTMTCLAGLGGRAFAEDCKAGYRVVEISNQDTGAVVYGPVCVQASFNALRYDAYLGLQTTYTYVDLSSFGASPGAAPGTGPSVNDTPGDFLGKMPGWIDGMTRDLQQKSATDDQALATVKRALAEIVTLVDLSDKIFQGPGGKAALLARVQDNGFRQERIAAMASAGQFELINRDQIELIRDMQNQLTKIQLQNPVLTSDQKTVLTNSLTAVAALLTMATNYGPTGSAGPTFQQQFAILTFWNDRIDKIDQKGSAAFYTGRNVACNVVGNESKTVAVVLNRLDLSPFLTGAIPTVVTASAAPVTVNCPSRFSLSGGLAMSFVSTPTYGLLPTATSGTYIFGITKSTNHSVMPIAMLHGRLFMYRQLGFHAGFGVAAHTQDDGAGGTGAEYLLGAGISIWRTIFITPGWHVGRTASLSPGYKLGDTAASGVSAAPLVNGYSSGFGLAITFTKP